MIEFPEKINVTGQSIDISNLTLKQKEYFVRFKEKLAEIFDSSDKDRVIISLSGISGTGKTSMAQIAKILFEQEEHDFAFYSVGIDAFHINNEALEEKNLKQVKGRFDTYNTVALSGALRRFGDCKRMSFPVYSRATHDPIQNGFTVLNGKALLLVEGLWMLRDDKAWNEIRKHVDYSFFIKGNEKKTKKSVISRHVLGGRSQKEAEEFYELSDHENAKEILKNIGKADEKLNYYGDI